MCHCARPFADGVTFAVRKGDDNWHLTLVPNHESILTRDIKNNVRGIPLDT